jgi:C-terminal processing protease CtpA/Prc
MKSILAAAFLGFAPLLALAQTTPPPDEPVRPKPFQPIIASQHDGPGRIGVRLVFLHDSGLPQIAGLTRGGPAADVGFRVGDIIIKIDKNYTNSLSPDDAKLALHGQPGTGVELTVQRGNDPKLITIACERRVLPADAIDELNPDTDEVAPEGASHGQGM